MMCVPHLTGLDSVKVKPMLYTRQGQSPCARRVENLMSKPPIAASEGPAPKELLIEDITVGEGAEAVAGGMVEVHYVGDDYETGEEFDSSWDRGESIQFPLSGLIEGWQEGIPGMKVGGRRKLTIPPEMAYGTEGTGHPLAGRTLVFVIDLIDAK